VLEQVQLGGHLRPADDAQHRAFRLAERGVQHLQFARHREAGVGGEQAGDGLGRGVGAVRGAEGVVDEEIAELGEFGGEAGVVGLLASMEAQVLQQGDAARLQRVDDRGGFRTRAVGGEGHGSLQQIRERLHDRAQAHALHPLALWSIEMGEQHRPGPGLAQRAYGRQRRAQPRVVRNRPILHGHVEVDADERPLAGDVARPFKCAEWHGCRPLLQPLTRRRSEPSATTRAVIADADGSRGFCTKRR
jgi:hypothetical protein